MNYQVILKQTLFGKEVLNILNWQLAADDTQYLADFADALHDTMTGTMDVHATQSWSLNSLLLRKMDGGSPFTVEQQFTAGPLVGLNSNESLPTTVALLVSTLYTGPRPNRGRIYFAGLCENNAANSAWGPGTLQVYEDMVQEWAGGITVPGGNAFLRIATVDAAANSWPSDSPVTAAVGRSRPATIRNRRLS